MMEISDMETVDVLTPEELKAALECWTEGPEQPHVKFVPSLLSNPHNKSHKIKVNMNVKFKKLLPGAVLPKKATDGSAAYDLYVPRDIIIKPGRQVIPLGFAMEMEPGHEALVDPRSGFSSKGMEGYEILHVAVHPLHFGNVCTFAKDDKSVDPLATVKKYIALEPERFDCDIIEGKIDSDFRDGTGVIVHNRDTRTFLVKAGTRIAQMTFHKVEDVEWEQVEELSESDRKGGFGHTGTN